LEGEIWLRIDYTVSKDYIEIMAEVRAKVLVTNATDAQLARQKPIPPEQSGTTRPLRWWILVTT
jgi:hypothetical protein